MPDAVKLLATVADAADDPTFIEFSKNGLKFSDLFNNPSRVKRYVRSQMQLNDDVAQSLMTSEISFQGILNGNLNRCSPDSVSQTLVVRNSAHLQVITERLCALTKQHMQSMFMDLLYEINFSKYIKMVSNLIQKFIDLLKPTFGDTKEYQSAREFADTAVTGVQYFNKIFGSLSNHTEQIDSANVGSNVAKADISLDKINRMFDNAVEAASAKDESIDPFNVLTKLANFFYKFLSNNYKHDVVFYSTLIAKLMEGAHRVIQINMHIEEITYNVTLRNPQAIKLLKGLDPEIFGKILEALVSAERTQAYNRDSR
ncbi:putative ATP-binding cassette [Operophtera brumata]|uniref:Putative ATP-binding cassette n=1 Tax=Operophtera brumata TaxID=104452 RepID=A0A0L7LSN7_OPEBR|nr:putative ATP-binding cassette [Operophtera brumata]